MFSCDSRRSDPAAPLEMCHGFIGRVESLSENSLR